MKSKLVRQLGFWDVFAIAAGAMISSGLFVLPGLAFAMAGPGVVLSYALAGLMMVPAMLSQAELATAMPRSGGSYFFIERTMGALPGMLAGLANWLSIALKSAFALIGIGALARLIWPETPDWTIKAIAVGSCLLFTGLNLVSVRMTGRAQIGMVVVLLASLALFLAFGFPVTQHAKFERFMSAGMGVFATAGLVFVSYGGLTKVASVAGEIRDPGRNIPGGMFAAAISVSFVYVAAVFVVVGVSDPARLEASLTPLSDAARLTGLGRFGAMLLALAGMLAFFTTANSGILSASRNPMAMSRDGLLPTGFQKVSRRFQTPWVSILLTSGFIIAVVSLLDIPDLAKVASTMMLLLFVLVNLSVVIMRSSRLQNYRPLFRAPWYPWVQLAGIATYVLLILEMGRVPLLTTAAFAAAGAVWYVVYVRRRITRESAFVYMVKNVVSKEIYRSDLEEELKQIALERDEVVHDRFDRLVKDCVILDLQGPVPAEEMFRQVSQALAPRAGVEPDKLLDLFRAREAQSSTVLQPGLAIPHVIVDGAGLFDIVLVRCREGVSFPGAEAPVHTAFVLVGSRDERNYHLRALMAVAHIVQEHDFTRRWLAAPAGENLRDIVLLSRRQRELPGEAAS